MRWIAYIWIALILVLLFGVGVFLFSMGCPALGSVCAALFVTGIFSSIELYVDKG